MAWYNPLTWFNTRVPLTTSRGPAQFFSWNGKDIYFNLTCENDYREAYRSCPQLSTVINRRAGMFANGKLMILNKSKGSSNGNDKRGPWADQLEKTLQQPNILQSWNQFWAQMNGYIDLFGYCPFLKVEPAGMEGMGEYSSLWILPPWYFEIEYTGKWLKQTTKEGIYKEFYFTYEGRTPLGVNNVGLILDNGLPTDLTVHKFLPDPRAKSLEYPISNIRAALQAYNTLITKKGAIGILSNESSDSVGHISMAAGEKESLQNDFSRYGLSGDQWQVIITDANLKWQQMSFNAKDLQFFEGFSEFTKQICAKMGYKYELYIADTTFNNQAGAEKSQYVNFIVPDACSRIEQLSKELIPDEQNAYLYIDYSHVEVLQQSAKDRADAEKSLNDAKEKEYNNNVITIDDWREALGLNRLNTPPFNQYKFEVYGIQTAGQQQGQSGNNTGTGQASQGN